MMDEMYWYLSLVMILSVSSSNSSSNFCTSADTSGTDFIISLILSSFSINLMAKKRFCSSATSLPIFASTAEITASTLSANECAIVTVAAFFAKSTALSAASLMPVPFNAEIATTGQPSFSESLSK